MSSRRSLVALALLAVLAASTPAATAQTTELRASEGEWSGHISFISDGIPFRGGFQFTSAGGQLDGTFTWSGGGAVASGIVTGPDTRPAFQINRIVSQGIEVPDATGGGEIAFTTVTCERLEGTGIDVGAARFVTVEAIVWWAVRTSSAAGIDPFIEAYDALHAEVASVLETLRGGPGTVDGVVDRIVPLIAEAESLASDLSRSAGCSDEFYRALIAIEVSSILDHLLSNPDIPEWLLAQIVLTSARAGLIGSGVEGGPTDLDQDVQDLIAARILVAIEAADSTGLFYLALIAEDMGWTDLAADARFALEEMGG